MKSLHLRTCAAVGLFFATVISGACSTQTEVCGNNEIKNGTCQVGTCSSGTSVLPISDPSDMCPASNAAGGEVYICCVPTSAANPNGTMDGAVTDGYSSFRSDAIVKQDTGSDATIDSPGQTGDGFFPPPPDTGVDAGKDSGKPVSDTGTDAPHLDGTTSDGASTDAPATDAPATDAPASDAALPCDGDPTCTGQAVGSVCSANSQCTLGHCVDGVCCDGPCSGTCLACSNALTGMASGVCNPVTAGTKAPTGQCAASLPCGNTGNCGTGAMCEEGALGTACGSTNTCNNGMLTTNATCSGAGACTGEGDTAPCPGGFDCLNANVCMTSCTVNGDCRLGTTYCSNGACVPKLANGGACTVATAGNCATGECADGYCCDTACTGNCQACSAALTGGLNGTCGDITPGTVAPTGQCATGTTCGNDGNCGALGVCEQEPATVVCGTAACVLATGIYTAAQTCTGTGSCGALGAPGLCPDGTGCASATACACSSVNMICPTGQTCVAGACQ